MKETAAPILPLLPCMPSPPKPPSQLPAFPEDPTLGQVDMNGTLCIPPSLWGLLQKLCPVRDIVSFTFLWGGMEGSEGPSPDSTPVWPSHRK